MIPPHQAVEAHLYLVKAQCYFHNTAAYLRTSESILKHGRNSGSVEGGINTAIGHCSYCPGKLLRLLTADYLIGAKFPGYFQFPLLPTDGNNSGANGRSILNAHETYCPRSPIDGYRVAWPDIGPVIYSVIGSAHDIGHNTALLQGQAIRYCVDSCLRSYDVFSQGAIAVNAD